MRNVKFPAYSGVRCLMMPYIQGDVDSVPEAYHGYREIIESLVMKRGDIGFLTIDESVAKAGTPHRGKRAKFARALHTEAGRDPEMVLQWGSGGGNWGGRKAVTLDRDVRILLANNLDGSCAIWNAEHENTSLDGDIGHEATKYPYEDAVFMKAGEVREIGILTPHESLPVKADFDRQFLRIVSSGVHGREAYFTGNPLVPFTV
jgi:hypothetical protein